MESDTVGKWSVNKWRGIIEPTTGRASQTLRQSAHRRVIGKPDRRQLHAVTVVGPDLGCPVDGDVSDGWVGKQRLERAKSLKICRERGREPSEAEVINHVPGRMDDVAYGLGVDGSGAQQQRTSNISGDAQH